MCTPSEVVWRYGSLIAGHHSLPVLSSIPAGIHALTHATAPSGQMNMVVAYMRVLTFSNLAIFLIKDSGIITVRMMIVFRNISFTRMSGGVIPAAPTVNTSKNEMLLYKG